MQYRHGFLLISLLCLGMEQDALAVRRVTLPRIIAQASVNSGPARGGIFTAMLYCNNQSNIDQTGTIYIRKETYSAKVRIENADAAVQAAWNLDASHYGTPPNRASLSNNIRTNGNPPFTIPFTIPKYTPPASDGTYQRELGILTAFNKTEGAKVIPAWDDTIYDFTGPTKNAAGIFECLTPNCIMQSFISLNLQADIEINEDRGAVICTVFTSPYNAWDDAAQGVQRDRFNILVNGGRPF